MLIFVPQLAPVPQLALFWTFFVALRIWVPQLPVHHIYLRLRLSVAIQDVHFLQIFKVFFVCHFSDKIILVEITFVWDMWFVVVFPQFSFELNVWTNARHCPYQPNFNCHIKFQTTKNEKIFRNYVRRVCYIKTA